MELSLSEVTVMLPVKDMDRARTFYETGSACSRPASVRMARWSITAEVPKLGTGKRLFAEGTPARSFVLVSTQATPSGVILSTYKVAETTL